MKKSVLVLAVAFAVSSAFAQDLTSKKGEKFLPEANDWAISVDATSFLSYAGNMLSTNGANAPTWSFLNSNNTITGKMFKDEKTAYRASIRIGFGNTTTHGTLNTANDSQFVAMDAKTSGANIYLAGGMEMRRGTTRLQGFYGGEVGFGMGGGGKTKNTYAMSMSDTKATNGTRTTESKSGSTIMFGVRGFIGAEYFIFPKIAIGGEFGWGLGFSTTGKASSTTETKAGTTITTKTTDGAKGAGAFSLDTNGMNGIFGPSSTVRLTFHF